MAQTVAACLRKEQLKERSTQARIWDWFKRRRAVCPEAEKAHMDFHEGRINREEAEAIFARLRAKSSLDGSSEA
jgi:hypothetical protein